MASTVGWAQDKRKPTSEMALRSVFEKKSIKGARGFFIREGKEIKDEVKNKRLQVAFVIDGTDSMSNDIQGVKSAIDDFASRYRRLHDDPEKAVIEFAIVVFRDAKAGNVEFVQQKFTTDLDSIKSKIESIETKTGAPAYEEVMDIGIYQAIDTLDWQNDESTVRWIMVFGDAPPYLQEFPFAMKVKNRKGEIEEFETGRKYNNDQIIKAANAKGIALNFVLCNSGFIDNKDYSAEQREKLKTIFDETVPTTRQFMKSLADPTNGFVFDLSDEKNILQLAADAAKEVISLDPITPEDVIRARLALNKNIGTPTNLAVMPHVKRQDLQSWLGSSREDFGSLAAIQLAQKISLPGLIVTSRAEVAKAIKELSLGELQSDEELVVELGQELSVDFVVWGSVEETADETVFHSEVRSTTDGSIVASATDRSSNKSDLGRNNLAGSVAAKLLRAFQTKMAGKNQATMFVSTYGKTSQKKVRKPFGKEYRTSQAILRGLNFLEKSVEFKTGEPGALDVLKKARLHLKSALLIEPENVHAHLFLASCCFNLKEVDANADAKKLEEEFKNHLSKAFELRETAVATDIQLEIEGDYALFVQKDVGGAVKAYKEILASNAAEKSIKRANWMLAGIYAGEWGVAKSVTNMKHSRTHVLNIIARFEESSEAKFFKKQFNWDDVDGAKQPEFRASEYRLASNTE